MRDASGWLILWAAMMVAGLSGAATNDAVRDYRDKPAPIVRDIRAESVEAATLLALAEVSACGAAAPATDLATDALLLTAPYGEERYSLATVARMAEQRAAEWCRTR